MPLNAESLKTLDQVKKTGKPCKFVLVSKGVKVLNVVAYRKGSDDTRIREAKEAGNGTVSCGVVDGQGANLSFKLRRADGYEAVPVKPIVLKEFLNDGSELNSKPTIDIVDELPAVELEGEGQQRTQPQQPQNQPQTQFNYRTSDEWKTIIARIQSTTDKVAQVELLVQAARDCRTETDQVNRELEGNPNSNTAQAQRTALVKVAEILKRLNPQLPPVPQTPSQPPNRPPPPVPGSSQPPNRPPPPVPGQQPPQQMPPLPTPPLPPLPKTPQEQRRQAKLNEAQPGSQLAKRALGNAEACQEDPLSGADLDQLSSGAKQAAEKTRVGLHKDKILPTVVDALAAAKDLATHGRFAEAHARLLEAQQQWTAGKTAQEKERKGSILGATKEIIDNRLAEYTKLEPILNAAIAKIGAAATEMTHVGNELCKAVRAMLAEHQKGTPDALNALLVGNLESYLKSPAVPDTIAAVGQKLVQAARDALQAEFKKRETGTSPQKRAELLLELVPRVGSGGGTSGTSEVQVVRNFDGQVVHAFKPLDGESVQNDGDTLREALSSGMCQKFRELTNLDLGFPEVNVANVNGRQGVLIEGLNGFEIPAEKAREMSQEKQDELDQIARKVPPQEIQKAMLSAVVTGDFDMKWDNIFVGPTGDSARRFDGGKGFPDAKNRGDFFISEIQLNRKMPNPEGCLLLYSPCSFQPLAVATAPISPDLRRDFLKIKDKLDTLKKEMKQHVQESCRALSTTDKPQQMDDSVIDQTVRSIEAAIAILESNDQITTEQFFKAFASRRILEMAEDFMRDQQAAIGAYDENAVRQHVNDLGLKLDPDINVPVARIRGILQAGVTNYDDPRDGKQLHNDFRTIDRLLALQQYLNADPQAVNLNDWKKVAKVTGNPPFDQAECERSAWSALGMLTQPELLRLFELCAFNSNSGIDGNTVGIERPGAYPTLISFTTAAPDRPAKLGPQLGKVGISLPHKKGEPMNLPSANDLAALIRSGL